MYGTRELDQSFPELGETSTNTVAGSGTAPPSTAVWVGMGHSMDEAESMVPAADGRRGRNQHRAEPGEDVSNTARLVVTVSIPGEGGEGGATDVTTNSVSQLVPVAPPGQTQVVNAH